MKARKPFSHTNLGTVCFVDLTDNRLAGENQNVPHMYMKGDKRSDPLNRQRCSWFYTARGGTHRNVWASGGTKRHQGSSLPFPVWEAGDVSPFTFLFLPTCFTKINVC